MRGVGWSRLRNKPSNVSQEHVKHCSVHAEMDALRGLGYLGRGTVYVARLGAKDKPVLAKPCESCQDALMQSGIVDAYWTTDDAYGYGRLAGMGVVASA